MNGIADPKTSVVTTTIIIVVVTITPRLGFSGLSFSTRAKAIVPLTNPARKRYYNSQKFKGIFFPPKSLVRRRGNKIETYHEMNTTKSSAITNS